MAEQILKVKLVADVGQSEAALKLFTDSAKDAGVSIEKVFKAVNVETDKIAYDIKTTAAEIDSLDKAFKSAKAKFSEDETTKLSSSFIEVTKNIDAEAARIAKSRQKGFEEDLVKRTTRLKESLSLELALIREGENSITAIKLESASKQRKLEEKLQEDLAVVKQKFIDQDITAATRNTYINKLYASYKDATVKLNELTDERIAKANQEVADFNLVEKKLAETSARRVKLVEDREKALTDIQIAAAKKSQEVQNALIKQTVDALIVTEDKEYKRLLAARKANAEAAFGVGEPQASRDDRGYVPFAMGTVGGNRAAAQAPVDARAQTLQEAETRAFLARRAKAEKEWATMTPAIDNNTKALENNKKAEEQTSESHRSLGTHILEVIGIYRIYNASINTIINSLQAIPKIGIELESTKASLISTIGSEAGMGSALAALNEEATRTGIGINSLRESFRNFQASTSLSGVSLKETWQMFTNMNTVITALHLSTDQATHIFNALAQIFNKSKVQSEELVKQLGNLLPGAFASFQKANASAYKSTQELVQAMKQGTVFAQDTMLNFTIFLKDRFAASFAVASQGFNANVGRMQNSFTLLGEAIYNTSSGALNDAVKLITDITNTLTGAVTGANNFGETLKQVSYVIESVLIVAIVKAISNSNALKMSLLSLGGNAVLTAIGTAATALLNIGREQASIYEQAIARQKEFTDQKTLSDTAKPLEIRVEASKSVQDARKQLAELKKELGRVNSTEASIVYVGEERGTIPKEAALEDLNKAIAFQKELITKTIEASRLEILKADEEARKAIVLNGVNLEADIAKARENALKAQGKTTEGAIQEFTNTYGDKIEAAKKEIKSLEALAISGTEDQKIYAADKLSKLNQFLADLDTQKAKLIKDANKKVTTPETSEAYKASLEDAKNTALDLHNSVSVALSNIDILYQQNAMSIETYFSQKIQLQETDLAVQKEMLNQELQLAYAQKDKVKIQKLNGELIKAETDANKLATKTIIEKTNATRAYQAMALEGQAKVLAFQGRGGEAALGQFDVATRDKFEKFKIAGDTAALRNLEIERQNVALKGAIADIDEKRTLQEADYQASLERTNILKNTGAIGEFTALQQITAANEARIASMEEAVRVKELEIAKTEELVGVVDLKERSALKRLREELENFRLTSDAVAQHFDKVFSDSFTNAFTGFANGTMTAKQAFSSLITSMIGEIQKLIAQEMASAALRSVIRPLAGMAMSGLGGLFGGAVSGAEAATMGTGTLLAAANGGVFSGPGISAYSGSIVSKPTIFPFAKGTGLMGEAGPEAILPLTRNSKGKLGVIADSTGQSGGNVYNIEVTVQSSKDEKPADTGQKIAEAMMRTIAKQEIGLAARPGNSLNRTTKFG